MLTGRVVMQCTEELKAKEIRFELSGKAMVFWSDDKTEYSDEENYFEHVISLSDIHCSKGTSGDRIVTLKPGNYEYPFNFKLPDDIPSTYEGCMGDIRYKGKVVVQRYLRFDIVKECCFKVIRPLNLNEEPRALMAPLDIQYQKSVTWLCTGGLVDVDLYANRACFVPGEDIVINGQILNRTYGDIIETAVRLLQDTRFFVTHKDGRKFRSNSTLDEEVARVTRPKVGPGQADHWQDVPLTIPPLPESRLDGCKIISTTYCLQVSMRVSWKLKRVVFGKQLIVIGNIALRPPAVITPENMIQSAGDHGDWFRSSHHGGAPPVPELQSTTTTPTAPWRDPADQSNNTHALRGPEKLTSNPFNFVPPICAEVGEV